jgi:RsiW-degrading membrane proteinase PrsW (M82 family)
MPEAARATRRATTAVRPSGRPDGWRSKARWLLLLALLPLGLYVLTQKKTDLEERLRKTMEEHPQFQRRLQGGASKSLALDALPGKRIEGAFLPASTWMHWIIAAFAACLFWEFILIVQPMGTANSKQLWGVGVFTGTLGILMLLIVQFAAVLTPRLLLLKGPLIVVFLVLKFIGFSYAAATDPAYGFWPSFFGFTFGVGLCEEVCKILPVLYALRKGTGLDARGAVIWGLASGIGFGVSEGILYSSDYYNGLQGPGIYVVRFASCVGLHAVWTATAALMVWKRSREDSGDSWTAALAGALIPLSGPIVLHGLYDTLLKKDFAFSAFLLGVLSFALYFWVYDRVVRAERRGPAAA